ncbi:MAG: FAD-dependent monooxygenase [Polyangiaceae bacterium]
MTSALIVGGGPAGAALATLLAGAGREVTVLERGRQAADKVCGEFISVECAEYLRGLGLDLDALGAVRLGRLRVSAGDLVAETALPFAALSLSRRVLDEALLQRAAAAGAEVRRGAKVTALEAIDGRQRARLDDGSNVEAGAAFLATGKHDLRGWARGAGQQDDLVAFKLHWELGEAEARALAGHVELHLFADGYAGLQPIEGGRANLCLVVRKARFAALGHRWESLLPWMRERAPLLGQRLGGARACWERPLSLSRIPYGLVQHRADGVWRLGDQAAVIPSFSGDGMAIALHSAHLAARTWLDGGDAETYQRALAAHVRRQLRLATPLSRAVVQVWLQRPFVRAARRWPTLLRWVARATRVPASVLEPNRGAAGVSDRGAQSLQTGAGLSGARQRATP